MFLVGFGGGSLASTRGCLQRSTISILGICELINQLMAATLYCPNYNCQAPNPEHHKHCEKCRTLLPKRYLWSVEQSATPHQPGEIVGDRYLFKQQQIWLDTKPGSFSETPLELPAIALPYLKLIPYQIHLPQAYDWLETGSRHLLFLENIPLNPNRLNSSDLLAPALTQLWSTASPLRQLNWLWQIAQLWQPLSLQGVAATLLDPQLIRVEGPLIRLLELRPSGKSAPKLQQLGQLWSQWVKTAHPDATSGVQNLANRLIRGEIKGSEQLVSLLDESLAQFATSATLDFQIATLTNTGPSRRRNEDACYPPSGSSVRLSWDRASAHVPIPLTIVCDGIGGHEGGNVASQLAIETVQQRVEQLFHPDLHPDRLQTELEQAVCIANDRISQQNDSERRHERQRMGTTLVMALAQGHQMYITHVGDSRVYWITAFGCHQVTLDDDVATREVRLGYAFYRDALQHPGSGSLVQALGMSASDLLHPTVGRFILDGDGIFLLCSDGLSDGDRVEEYWESEILPVLNGQIDAKTAVERLVEIANTQNGHDNVTISLLHYRLLGGSNPPPLAHPESQRTVLSSPEPRTQSNLKTQLLPPSKSDWGILPLILGILLLLGLGVPLAYLLGVPNLLRAWQQTPVATSEPSITVIPSPDPPPVAAPPQASLEARSLVQVEAIANNGIEQPAPLFLFSSLQAATERETLGEIPPNSLLYIQGKQTLDNTEVWLNLRVCTVGPLSEPNLSAPVVPGNVGWVREIDLLPRSSVTSSPPQGCP